MRNLMEEINDTIQRLGKNCNIYSKKYTYKLQYFVLVY